MQSRQKRAIFDASPDHAAPTRDRLAVFRFPQPGIQVSIANFCGVMGPTLDARSAFKTITAGVAAATVVVTAAPSGFPAAAAVASAKGTPTQSTLVPKGVTAPVGVAVDGAGDVFTLDPGLISGQAVVQELAFGENLPTVLPLTGIGSVANPPRAVAVDSNGDVVVGTEAGQVVELSSGASGGTVLPFGSVSVEGIAIDSSGDVFVADSSGNQVLELPNGATAPVVLPFSGQAIPGFFPTDVAVDGRGDLFVSYSYNQIWELTAGSSRPTPLNPTPYWPLNDPQGIAADASGDVFVADTGGQRVWELPAGATSAAVLPFVGLTGPKGIAVDGGGGVYVVDGTRILELSAGSGTASSVPFNPLGIDPGVAVDKSGNVYLAVRPQAGSGRVLKLSPGAASFAVLPFGPSISPNDIAVDHRGDVFITDGASKQVLELAVGSDAPVALPFGSLGFPTGIAVDRAGDVFVGDSGSARILELSARASSPTVLDFASELFPCCVIHLAVDARGDVFAGGQTADPAELAAGATSAAPIEPLSNFIPGENVSGIGVDRTGNVFVTDNIDSRIYEQAADTGIVTELASDTSPPSNTPYTVAGPYAIAIDSSGDLFVTTTVGFASGLQELSSS